MGWKTLSNIWTNSRERRQNLSHAKHPTLCCILVGLGLLLAGCSAWPPATGPTGPSSLAGMPTSSQTIAAAKQVTPLPATPAATPTRTLDRLGMVAFAANKTIYTMRADGTDLARVSDSPGQDEGPSWSPDGRQIAFRSAREGIPELYVMNADGSGLRRLAPGIGIGELAWAPDGKRIAFAGSTDGKSADILVISLETLEITNVNRDPASDNKPAWSPDGKQIAFTSDREGERYLIYVMEADGTNIRRLSDGPIADEEPAWSPDGTKIAYTSGTPAGSVICLVNPDGSGETALMPRGAWVGARHPTWSPDGRRIAYGDPAGLTGQILVMNADGSNATPVRDFRGSGLHVEQPTWQPVMPQ